MKLRFLTLLFLLAGVGSLARAQVDASLVSSVAEASPGHSFTVALHFVHRATWHTYWLNPGTGLPTSIKWTLPPGYSASDIEWPAPHLIKDGTGTVTGNGYTGDLLLPVTITPPADAKPGPLHLAADVDWLMCQNVCEPGNAKLTLDVAMGAGSDAKPNPEWAGKIQAVLDRLPRADAAWPVTASRTAKNVTVQVRQGSGASGTPTDLHFYSDDNLVGYDLPQQIASDGHGGFVLTLAISPDGPQDAKILHGVLTSASGWNAAGTEPGLRVDVPFGAASTAAATASAPGSGGGAAPAGGAASAAPATGSLGGTLFLAFIGGLILNLMPCVFPVLGIKILGFVRQAGSDRKKVAAHGLTFTAGVLLSFWTLAGLLALLRSGGSQLGWGFQLQSPGFIFGLAAGLLIFALNLSGVFEFGLGATALGGNLQSQGGLAGSFFSGVLATVVATPCSAPFLAPALGAALTLPLAASFAVFTCVAIGLSTPYLVLSAFPAAVKVLPRPGAWMETFKQFMAFPLYATVAALVWVLAGQVADSVLLNAVLGLVVIALAVWIYGRFHAAGAAPGRARFGLIAGFLILAAGAYAGWPTEPPPDAVVWQKWSPEEVAQLRAQGRIVYVDFTARWCATCQANKKLVFHSEDVLRTFRDRKIATLRGDWTSRDPAITAELIKYHRSAVPFNQVWLPGHADPVLLPEVLTPAEVLRAVKS